MTVPSPNGFDHGLVRGSVARGRLWSWAPLMVAALLWAWGCARDKGKSSPPGASVSDVVATTELVPGEHLLFAPEPEPGDLLGREVTRDQRGYLVVAPERKPGCRVIAREVDHQYQQTYDQALETVAAIGVAAPGLVDLKARYEGELRVSMKVDNTTTWRADLEGECGSRVVSEVRVGGGARRVVLRRGGGSEVVVPLPGGAGVEAQGRRERGEAGWMAWPPGQGWAIKLVDGDRGSDMLRIAMPEEVRAGREYTVRIDVREPMWLVVLVRDAAGHHEVVLPRGQYPAFQAKGARVELPKLVSTNLPGHSEDRERLLVYGFTDEDDFQTFVPPAGRATPEQVDAYVADLERRLAAREIPAARWARATFDFVIRVDDGAGDGEGGTR